MLQPHFDTMAAIQPNYSVEYPGYLSEKLINKKL